MSSCEELLQTLKGGGVDELLTRLYAPLPLSSVKERAEGVITAFQATFGPGKGAALFSGPGRTEIGGNHTDHQHGHVLCASVNLDMLACAAPNGTSQVRILSEGYPPLSVELSDLAPRPSEQNTSAALVRGVAARLTEGGHTLGGMDVYMTSNVLSGSGLSSSAAYEVLVGSIFNHFFCGGAVSQIELAKIGQYAENVYFGKPCGLMDQMGSAVGGAVAIDFANPAEPVVRPISYDFAQSGHVLCIVDTGSCHADLTDDYADITREMGAVAAYFGQSVLRDVSEGAFRAELPDLRRACGDRAVLRAMHFFEDDRRAVEEADALEAGDFDRFLRLVNESGRSSALLLQNTWSPADPAQQAIPLALALGEQLLEGSGAIRVHGGGFAGTIQAFVPLEKLEKFRDGMEALLGQGRCHVLAIRPQGGGLLFQ